MFSKEITATDLLELCARLTEAEAALLAAYSQSDPPEELSKAFALLWDSCQEYQTTFESYSK